MNPGELLAVGRITRAHGVRGEVAVLPLSEVSSRFEPGSILRLGPNGDRSIEISEVRRHQDRLLVRFAEVTDRTEAESLRGLLLLVPAAEAPDAPEEGFWIHEVVGLEVVTEDGRSLGRIREVLANPANDLWVTEEGVMVPAVHQIVRNVDVGAGKVVVREIPGLLGEET